MKKKKTKINLIQRLKLLPTKIQVGVVLLFLGIFTILFSAVAKNSLAATNVIKTGTLNGYPVELSTVYNTSKPTVSIASDNRSGSITLNEMQYGQVQYKISNLEQDAVYKVSTTIKASNFTSTSDSDLNGAVIGTVREDTDFSHYNFAWSKQGLKTSNSTGIYASVYIIADSNGEATIFVGTVWQGAKNTLAKGTISFSNLTIAKATSNDIKTFGTNDNSTTMKVKLIIPATEYNSLNISEKDATIQSYVNYLAKVNDAYSYFCGQSAHGSLYPFKGKPVVINYTNTHYAGALAGYPIEYNFSFTEAIKNFQQTGGLDWGILHEMGHNFDHTIYSKDGTYHNKQHVWSWDNEMWANMKALYVDDAAGVKLIGTDSSGKTVEISNFEAFKNTYDKTLGNASNRIFSSDALAYLLVSTTNSQGAIDWEAMRHTFKWFNNLSATDSTTVAASNANKFSYFIKKYSEFSRSGYKDIKDVLQQDTVALDVILKNYNIKKIIGHSGIKGDDTIPKGQTKQYKWVTYSNDGEATSAAFVYTSSNPAVATVDEFGRVTAHSVGTTDFSVTSIFQPDKTTKKKITVVGECKVELKPLLLNSIVPNETVPSTSFYVEKGTTITLPNAQSDEWFLNDWCSAVDYGSTSDAVNTWKYTGCVGGSGTKYKVTGDVTLYAKFETKRKTVKFNATGIEDKQVDKGTTITLPDYKTENGLKENYTFSGWYTSSDFKEGTYAGGYQDQYVITEDVTLYPRQEQKSMVNIRYDVGSDKSRIKSTGNRYKIERYYPGDTIKLLVTSDVLTPYAETDQNQREISYMEFFGWNTGLSTVSGYTGTHYEPGASFQVQNNDVTFTAEWRRYYQVTFDSRGGSNVSSQKVYEGQKAKTPTPAPTLTCSTFAGWKTESNQPWNFETTVTSNMTLHAEWSPIQYTVQFNTGGVGGKVESQTVSCGGQVLEPTLEIEDRYLFHGWYKDQAHTQPYQFTDPVTSSFTLYAYFEEKTFQVEFQTPEGTTNVPATQKNIKYGAYATEPSLAPVLTGYTFEGWFKDAAYQEKMNFQTTKITENMTLYGKFTPIEYKIQFVTGYEEQGVRVPTIVGYYNTQLVAPENPVAPKGERVAFEGWYEKDSSVPYQFGKMEARNITLYAKWRHREYYILFDSKGGSHEENIELEKGQTIPALPTPTKRGYRFTGWYQDDTCTTLFSETIMPERDITLYAGWEAKEYTITFESNGGSDVAAITKQFGEAVLEPQKPTKKGYTFLGWYQDRDGKRAYTFTTMPDENITLYAKWEKNWYTITFDSNGGSQLETITAQYGDKITEPKTPTKKGYTFQGWYLDNTTFKTAYTFGEMKDENITLYAKWSLNQYTIHFNSNGGSPVKDITAYYATLIQEPLPVREGYLFDGWYLEKDLKTKYVFKTMPDEDLILYAKWSKNTFTITFESNGGSQVASIKALFGGKIKEPTPPVKEGYTFAGWYTSQTFEQCYTFINMPAKNFTLYAKWIVKGNTNPQEKKYTITFESNGGSEVKSMTARYQEQVVEPVPPVKEGYTFSGWYQDKACKIRYSFYTMPNTNFTLYAGWTKNQYTIRFNSNGGSSVEQIEAFYQESIKMPPEPKKEGYIFKGWYQDEAFQKAYSFDKMPAKNIVLYAKWERETIKIEGLEKADDMLLLKDLKKSYSQGILKKELKLPEYYEVKITNQDRELLPTDLIPTGSISHFYIDKKEIEKHVNVVKGDVTKDGKIDLEDISSLANYLLKKQGLEEEVQRLAADLNEDNKIRLGDLVTIYQEREGVE